MYTCYMKISCVGKNESLIQVKIVSQNSVIHTIQKMLKTLETQTTINCIDTDMVISFPQTTLHSTKTEKALKSSNRNI